MKNKTNTIVIAVISFSLALGLAACARPGSDKTLEGIKTRANDGGVDVGNMSTKMGLIPHTNASIGIPNSWVDTTTSNSLIISNTSGSQIVARKVETSDLTSPTPLSLQKHLNAKHPDRNYILFNVGGMQGVRANLTDTTSDKSSDIYLLSELNDFIHIESRLKSADNGISQGEAIISTVRVKYQGLPYSESAPKTVTLEARDSSGKGDRYAYSFVGDCFTYDRTCNQKSGTAVMYESLFSIGTSGYSHGRIIDLGHDSKVPFDSVKVEGDSLVAPAGPIPLADIYTVFTPKNPNQDQNRIQLQLGHTYLVRTINWPEEEVITKMHVDALTLEKSVQITYQKLVYVPETELQKQVDQAIEYTKKYEQPLATGEVTLYNWSTTNSYFFASFNFEYSTSGNMFITRNSWDFRFEGRGNDAVFSGSASGQGLAAVIDVGVKDIATISESDFPDPNTYSRKSVPVKKGHTYLVYKYDGGNGDFGPQMTGRVLGAVTVIDVANDSTWVQLKFRRIKISAPDHFQKWIPLRLPEDVVKTNLPADSVSSRYHPFIMKRASEGSHYYESFNFNSHDGPALATDTRPFGSDRGFLKIGTSTTVDGFTLADLQSRQGQYQRDIKLQVGDLIAGYFENYYNITVVTIRVERLNADKSVDLSIRYLQRAKTAYSDDSD